MSRNEAPRLVNGVYVVSATAAPSQKYGMGTQASSGSSSMVLHSGFVILAVMENLAPGLRHAGEALGEEGPRPPSRVGRPGPEPGVHHVSRPRHHGHQRVVAPDVGVGEPRPSL